MTVRRIGKLGKTAVEVRSTDAPWSDGFGEGVVVIPVGSFNSVRGRLAEYWRDNLLDGPEFIRTILQQLGSTNRVAPAQPAWLTIPIPQFGDDRFCSLCIATAFDKVGPHADNSRRAASAIITGAGQRKYRWVSLPLLGAGAGGLDTLRVLSEELEGIATAQANGNGLGIETVAFIVEGHELDVVADAAESFLEARSGIAKWSEALKDRGRFGRMRVLEDLAGGYSGAALGVCEVWDEHQTRLPLSVFKIGPTKMIEREAALAKQAVEILGEYAVEVRDSFGLSDGFAALRMPLVGDAGTARAGLSFLKFFAASGDPHETAAQLRTLFGKATRYLYGEARAEWCKPEKLRQFMEQARGGRYWSEASVGFMRIAGLSDVRDLSDATHVTLKAPIHSTIENFFGRKSSITTLWDDLVEVPQCHHIHGDLNPRNVVMIRMENQDNHVPRIVDFHRFGEAGPLALDFARFEAGIQVKCIEKQIASASESNEERELLNYESYVNDTDGFVPWKDKSLVGMVDPNFTKAVMAISAIRECFTDISPIKDRRDYWWCLFLCLLSYLRPVYDGRLTDEQRTYAIHVASSILSRHLLS